MNIKFSDYEDRIKLELKNRCNKDFLLVSEFVTLICNKEIISDIPANKQDNRYYHLAVEVVDKKH